MKLAQNRIDALLLARPTRIRRVDHVQQQVGIVEFFEGRAERVDELFGSAVMNPTVSTKRAIGFGVRGARPQGRVEGGERLIRDEGALRAARVRQPVQER